MARGISVVITGSAAPLRRALKDAEGQLSGFSKASLATMATAAAATTLFARSAIKAAGEDQKQQALLAGQLASTTHATRQQISAVESYIDATARATGITDTDLRTAFATLSTGTRDLATSQSLLNVAMDVSTATGSNLAGVAEALSKGYNGNTKQLAQLSPELKTAIKAGADFDQVLTLLRDNFGGRTQQAAQTFEGRMAILRVSIDEAKEAIGTALLPTIERLVPALIKVAEWAGKNTPLITKVAIAVGSFSAALVVANAAAAAWKAIAVITTAVNAALGTSFLAVQVATGVGIATAIAGVAAYLKLKDTFSNLKTEVNTTTGALQGFLKYGLTETQYALATFVGPLNTAANAQREYLNSVLKSRIAAEEYREKLARQKQAQEEAARAAKQQAEANRKNLVDSLKAAKDAIRAYVEQISRAITAGVSLSAAVSKASDEEITASDRLKEALEDRRDAYAALQQAKATGDAKAYGEQLLKVADAEKKVTEAQAIKPRNYSQIFADQISSAKAFAGYIKQLAPRLSRAALQQVLDLGPIAGSQVAKDLLSGTGAITTESLNRDIAAIAEAGTAAGMAVPGFQQALAATVTGPATAPQITINTGVGDPVKIGQEVADVLKTYGAKTGGVPIVVKQPKAPAKKKTTKRVGK